MVQFDGWLKIVQSIIDASHYDLSVMYSMYIFPHFKFARPTLDQTVNPTTFTYHVNITRNKIITVEEVRYNFHTHKM